MFCCKKVNFLINIFSTNLLKKNTNKCFIRIFCEEADQSKNPERPINLNKAMRAYLERARSYNQFIHEENQKFNTGKRHLANMMGLDPQTITQEQIDESIEYLFPSGLFEKKARPLMKPPMVVFPPRKAAQFDETGRPFHFLFYTGKPNFYELLHEFVQQIHNLNTVEDEKIKTRSDQQNASLDVTGSQWLDKDELENMIVEELHDIEYKNFLAVGDRLLAHKYSSLAKDVIMKYRKRVVEMTMSFVALKPEVDSFGREFITVKDCPRKNARANVTVRRPGRGLISINGQGIEYFSTIQSRNQILYPLDLTGLRVSVDVEATVSGGGETGQAGAIRWGISWALRSFVNQDMIETMRLAGLLTRDYRRRERKKPGQAKARKKFTWKKR